MAVPGEQILHRANPAFHASREVEGVVAYLKDNNERIPNDPHQKIAAYLGFLAEVVEDGILCKYDGTSHQQESIERQVEFHTVKPQDIPRSFFEQQHQPIVREEGDIDELSEEERQAIASNVREDQRAGLRMWIDLLGNNDDDKAGYPQWFKHYAWTSITRLGAYNKDKTGFTKRSSGTTAPFPEPNREAIAYVYDALVNKDEHGKKIGTNADDAKLQELLKKSDFGELYAYAMHKIAERRQRTDGSWVTFAKTSAEQDIAKLYDSIQGYGTGWCVAWPRSARTNLAKGDIHVYYTRDDEGRDTTPRVAIRTERRNIAEVRGINAQQQLEPAMYHIAVEMLAQLPGGNRFIDAIQDAAQLERIKESAATESSLDPADIRFLYELDRDIHDVSLIYAAPASKIRALRGEKDRAKVGRLVPEIIRGQMTRAFKTYADTVNLLGLGEGVSQRFLTELLAAKDNEWRHNGVYDYIAERAFTSGARYTLVVAPNATINTERAIRWTDPYDKTGSDIADTVEWSPDAVNAPVRICLIPTKCEKGLDYGTVADQISQLELFRQTRPNLNYRIPSLVDAIAYWHALHAQGIKPTNANAYIRHFDLPTVLDEDQLCRVSSIAHGGGNGEITLEPADSRSSARLAVG